MTSQLNYAPVYHNNSEWPIHIWVGRLSDGETRCYVEQRTCRNVSKSEYSFRCSECDATDLDFQYPDFCHGCGAKVVEE